MGFLSASFKAWSAGESRSGALGAGTRQRWGGEPALLGEVGAGAGVLSHAVHTHRLVPRLPRPSTESVRCLSIAALIPPLRVYVNSFPSKTSVAFIVSKLVVCEKPHSRGLGVPVPAVGSSDWPSPGFLTCKLVTEHHCPVRLPRHLPSCVYLGLLLLFLWPADGNRKYAVSPPFTILR